MYIAPRKWLTSKKLSVLSHQIGPAIKMDVIPSTNGMHIHSMLPHADVDEQIPQVPDIQLTLCWVTDDAFLPIAPFTRFHKDSPTTNCAIDLQLEQRLNVSHGVNTPPETLLAGPARTMNLKTS